MGIEMIYHRLLTADIQRPNMTIRKNPFVTGIAKLPRSSVVGPM